VYFTLYAMPATGTLTTVSGTPSAANQLNVSAYHDDKFATAPSGRTAYLGYPTSSSLELCFENLPISFDITTTGIVSGRVTCSGW
jgi:hypothetical protein